MIRAAMVGAIVVCVGLGFMVTGGVWLVVLAVVLAYLLGRDDADAKRRRARPGYVERRSFDA